MRTKKIGLRLLVPFLLAACAFTYAFASSPVAHAQSAATFNGGTPRFVALNHNVKLGAFAARNNSSGMVDTIPYWSDLFNANGNPYPFQMVGTNPANGSHHTTVPTEIIALKVVFSDGNTLNGADNVKNTVNSPLFEDAQYSSGNTQYGDAMQRAEFWHFVQHGSKDYHVTLGDPKVLHTVTLNVPSTEGQTAHSSRTGALIGLIDIDWFDAQIQTFMLQLHISPKTLPIFLTNDVFLYEGGDPANCCVIGYHSAVFSVNGSGRSQIQTYAWGSYTTPGIFSVPIDDINGLSHEVAEWYNDPFVDNVTPNWQSPIAPQYGCNNFLEVGDPLVGVTFIVRTDHKNYHPQDEAFFSWFAQQTPSLGIHHQYTYLGTFTSSSAASSC